MERQLHSYCVSTRTCVNIIAACPKWIVWFDMSQLDVFGIVMVWEQYMFPCIRCSQSIIITDATRLWSVVERSCPIVQIKSHRIMPGLFRWPPLSWSWSVQLLDDGVWHPICMALSSVSEHTGFGTKLHHHQTVWLSVPVITDIYTNYVWLHSL